MSTPKEIIFEEEAREKLQTGINRLAEVVGFTLGPKGRNVGIEKSWGPPKVSNDGGDIVKDIDVEGFEGLGVSIAKEMAEKIKEKAGDGTTTGILLLRALVENGVKHIAAGGSPILIKRGMEKAVAAVVDKISAMAKPVEKTEQIRNIATVSASGDTAIGDLITDAMEKVGREGVILVEEAKGIETTIEIVEGLSFDRGYVSSYFVTNGEKMITEMDHPRLLVTDKKISNVHEILPLLQAIAATGESLLIIAEDIEADALSTLVVNKLRGTLKVAAVKAPGFGDKRKAMLEDIAILTGSTLVSEDLGMNLPESTPDVLGHAQKITISKDKTIIVSEGREKEVKARIAQIENEIESSTSSYDKEKLVERKAKLCGGVAIIRVGASSESGMEEKKRATQNSLSSTRSAIEEGVVPGGGVALAHASKEIDKLDLVEDELLGAHAVKAACLAPLKQIIDNCGFDGALIAAQLLESKPEEGFNALTGKTENLIASGVIDPAKVVRNALIHASSSAGVVLLSEALIINDESDE